MQFLVNNLHRANDERETTEHAQAGRAHLLEAPNAPGAIRWCPNKSLIPNVQRNASVCPFIVWLREGFGMESADSKMRCV